MTLILMYFVYYRLRRTWLDKCLKSLVLEDPLISDPVSGPKLCYNLKATNITIFIDHYQAN